jgi:small subunit ribosomal protein S8
VIDERSENRPERTERTDRVAPPVAPAGVAAPAVDRPRRVAPPQPKKPRRISAGTTDPVSDMLTRLRNGARARHETVAIPASRLKADIAKILKAEGFIAAFDVQGQTLTCRLRYVDGGKVAAITDVQRVSRPGRRTYSGRRDLPLIRRGLGITIISTSQGVMTGADATKKGLGGEILAAVW